MKILQYYIYILFFFVLLSCQNENQDDFNQITSADTAINDLDITSEMAMEVLEQMPSPLEISSLIKKSGLPYSSSSLNSVSNLKNYTTNAKKALNFGVYGTDLGYINMYSSKQHAINYLEAVTNLSQDLNISHFFNFDLLQKLATHEDNLDSLMKITTQSFEEINDHLALSQKGDLGALIITGGWVEALYLACEVTQKTDNKLLKEKIADQKTALSSLLMLVNTYKDNSTLSEIGVDLQKLQKVFNSIEVKEGTREAKVVEEDGIPMYQDKKVVNAIATEEQLEEIRKIIFKIRADIIK